MTDRQTDRQIIFSSMDAGDQNLFSQIISNYQVDFLSEKLSERLHEIYGFLVNSGDSTWYPYARVVRDVCNKLKKEVIVEPVAITKAATKPEEEAIYNEFENELEEVEQEGKAFRFFNQRAMLTYKTHLDKAKYIDWLKREVSSVCKEIVFIRLAHESGDKSHNYLHTHVVVDFGKAIDKKGSRFFDYEGIHPNIKKIKNDKHFRNSQRYLAKEDKENADLKDIKCSLAEEIWSCESRLDAARSVTRLGDIMGAMMLYDMKEVSWMGGTSCAITSEEDMYPWQKKIFSYTHSEPDDRSVCWIHDKKGRNGKNQLLKYCTEIYRPDKYIWIQCSGKVNDIMNVLSDEIQRGWRGDTIFINLSRSATSSSEMTQVYCLIENLKDGMISHTKYKGFRLKGCPKFHVVVLSNTYPHKERLTGDRWMIGWITEERNLVWEKNEWKEGGEGVSLLTLKIEANPTILGEYQVFEKV